MNLFGIISAKLLESTGMLRTMRFCRENITQKNQLKRVAIGAILMMSFFSKLALSNSFNDYHHLSDNLVESEHYEVKKLINGEIDTVLFSKETNSVLVLAGRYIWKINDEGYITDTLFGASSLHSSGITLWTESWGSGTDKHSWFKRFNDWVYTGDKSAHTISYIEDSDNLTDDELIKRLDSADIIEFFTYRKENKDELTVSLLKEKNLWTALNISNRLGEIDSRCKEYRKRSKDIWQEACLDGYDKEHKTKLIPLQDSLPYEPNFQDKSQPLYIQKFIKEHYYFEEGVGGWLGGNILGRTILSGLPGELPSSYWYGTGYFQLNHNAEQLNFKAFVSNEDGRIDFRNIAIYDLPDNSQWAPRFIEISYKGGEYNYSDKNEKLVKYHENDVGLYVVRKKARLPQGAIEAAHKTDITFGQRASYNTHNPWLPVFTGKFIRGNFDKSIWGDISFYNTAPHHYLLNTAAVQTGIYSIPRTLTFDWEGRYTSSAYKLYLNDEKFVWLDFHRFADNIFFELDFDEAEMVEAFALLDGMNEPLQLEMHIEEIENSVATLSIRLRNNKQSVDLKHFSYKYTEPVYGDDNKNMTIMFERSKLEIEYERALSDKRYLQGFLDVSHNITVYSPYVKKYASEITKYTVDLFQHYMKNSGYESAKTLYYHYVNKLYPNVLDETNSEDVAYNSSVMASQGLVLSLLTSDEHVAASIFDKLMGPNFDISAQNNPTFMFNLACYYAVHKEKESLLKATKQALKRGKAADQFMSDSDFKNYWDDADFLNVLAEE